MPAAAPAAVVTLAPAPAPAELAAGAEPPATAVPVVVGVVAGNPAQVEVEPSLPPCCYLLNVADAAHGAPAHRQSGQAGAPARLARNRYWPVLCSLPNALLGSCSQPDSFGMLCKRDLCTC